MPRCFFRQSVAVKQSPAALFTQRHPVRQQRQPETLENISGDQVRRLIMREREHVREAFGWCYRLQVAAHTVNDAGGKAARALHAAFVPPEHVFRLKSFGLEKNALSPASANALKADVNGCIKNNCNDRYSHAPRQVDLQQTRTKR